MAGPLAEFLHLSNREGQEAIRVLEMLVLKNVDDGLLGAPYVELVAANALASLQNHLLRLVILSHEDFFGITGCISRYFILDVFCKL